MSANSDTDSADESQAGSVAKILATVVPDVIRKRFAVKFALVLVVMGLILAAIGFTATGALSTQVEDDTRLEYERLANQQASLIETWTERNIASIRFASQDQELNVELTDNSSFFKLSNRLTRSFGTQYASTSMYLVSTSTGDAEPAVVAHPDWFQLQDPVPVTDSGRDWLADVNLQDMTAGDVRMSDVYTVDDEPVVGFVSRVEGPLRRFLVVEVGVEQIATVLDSGGTDDSRESAFTQVVNPDGKIQVDTRTLDDAADSTVLENYANSETIDLAFQDRDGANRTSGVRIVSNDPDVLEQEYAVGYASVENDVVNKSWAVVTHASTDDLFGFVRTISQWGQIVTVLAALLIGAVGAGLGYSTASSVDRLRRKAEEIEQGNLDVPIHSTRIDSIGRLYDGFDNMRDALREQINEAEQARKEAEVSRAEAMEMNEYLQEKAEEYSQTMERCAAGNLTRRMEIDGENEAMDRIAREFNEMIDELEKTTGQLKSFADEVEDAGEIVLNSSDSVQEASEQVADSVQRISDDAYEQQEQLREISEEIDAISARLSDFAEEHPDIDFEEQLAQIDEVARTVADVVDLAEETLEESESVAGAAEEQAAELNEVSQRADDLIRYAGPLHDVLDRFETESEHEFYFPTGPRDEEGTGE